MNKNNQNSSRPALSNYVFRPEFSSLLILIVMFTITAILQENFFTLKSIVRNINAFAPLILLAMGAAVVIISGGIDLSAGSALSLFTCVLTTVMKKSDPITGVYAILVTLAVAILVGVVNGFGIGYLRIPRYCYLCYLLHMVGNWPFLATHPGGESVEWFRIFYNPGMIEGIHPYIKQFGRVIPPALILILAACLIWFIVSKTRIGRHIYAVGSNSESAYASGINTAKVQMQACIINSIFIFLAALFFVGQNQSGDARMGDPLTLRAIASAIVGGVAISGGKGSVYFALVGALILNFVNKIIFFADISTAYQTLVSGLIVIIAIAAPVAYTLYSKE